MPQLHALAYCLLHLVACTAAYAFAVLVYHWYAAYTLFALAMLTCALLNGAKRYNYYLVEVYSKKLHAAVEASLDGGAGAAAAAPKSMI